MKPPVHRFKIWIPVFAALGVVAAGAGVLLFLTTSPVYLEGAEAPDPLAAREAARKLKRFEEAQAAGQRGYICLAPVELNSLLQQRYLDGKRAKNQPTSPPACQLLKCRLVLTPNGAIWLAWVRKKWLGRAWDLTWQRTAQFKRATHGWGIEITGMRLGRLGLLPRFWPVVQEWFRDADLPLREPYDWLTRLPAVQTVTNEVRQGLDLKLYNYPEPTALSQR
ncbi:MAG: hypothetical protein M1608_17490 [Candidatus Omnitrophica bacterium]|nr:hypothetical protein [Candidatus Omnitrophota bacterium]